MLLLEKGEIPIQDGFVMQCGEGSGAVRSGLMRLSMMFRRLESIKRLLPEMSSYQILR